MKHLRIRKNIFFIISILYFLLLSINYVNAYETFKLINMKATTDKTIDIQINGNIKDNESLKSDLDIYRSIINTPKVDIENLKKVILTLKSDIQSNKSYSLISISNVEGNIIFRTDTKFLGKEIHNNDLMGESQGIKKLIIKDKNTIELYFLEDIDLDNLDDLEFQLYKTIEVQKIKKAFDSTIIKVLLKNKMENNSELLGTLTYLETKSSKKVQIEKGIYYFSTKELRKYDPLADQYFLKNSGNQSLEDTLTNALDNSRELNFENGELLDSENEINRELESAKEKDIDDKKTQLEQMALRQKQTPESGAETWVLIFVTFIVNTFYFLSRRKRQ